MRPPLRLKCVLYVRGAACWSNGLIRSALIVAWSLTMCSSVRERKEVIVSLSSCQEPTVHFYVGLRCARRTKKSSQLVSKREDINTNLLAAISAGENVTILRTNQPTPLKRGSLQKAKRSRSDAQLPFHKWRYRGRKKQLYLTISSRRYA